MSLKHLSVLLCLVAASWCAFVPALIELAEDGEVVNVFVEQDPPDEEHLRLRRQIKFDHAAGPGTAFGKVDFPNGGGVLGTGGYTAPIFSSPNGNLQGTAQASKLFGVPGGPANVGGQLDWAGKRGTAFAGVDHTIHGPTTMNLGANVPVWRPNKNTDLSVGGSYSRQFGRGAFPQPNYNVGATFRHNF